jgi:NADP-dependent 3-hydroxy acid dehydrogenase YdfG
MLRMLIATQGQVVFVNSNQALKAPAGIGQYAATKHAMQETSDEGRRR